MEAKPEPGKRILYLDLLRIWSVFCMIVLHVAAIKWYATPPASFDWQAMNAYDSLARFCVPAFIMVSGVFFLNPEKDITIVSIFKKYIPRILVAYIVWALLYGALDAKLHQGITADSLLSWGKVSIINTRYHLWFLPMLAGLYLITPILRRITVSKKITEYFMALGFVFALCLPLLSLIPGMEIARNIASRFQMYFAMGSAAYFVAGYYFFSNKMSRAFTRIVFVLGTAAAVFTILISSLLSVRTGEATEAWYAYMLPTIAFAALAVFLFFKDHVSKISVGAKGERLIGVFAKCSFGIYLVHDFFLTIFRQTGFVSTLFNPVFSIPIISAAVFLCSFGVSYCLNKIPFVNKYIV